MKFWIIINIFVLSFSISIYAQAELDLPQAELDLSQAELDLPQAELDLPQAELDLPEEELDLSQAELDFSEAELDFSEAELEIDFFSMDEIEEFAEAEFAAFDEISTDNNQLEAGSIFSAFRFSLHHAYSFRLSEPKTMINNRTGLNIDFAGSVAENIYAKIDASGSLFWSKDHRALYQNKDYVFDGLVREAWMQKSFAQLSFKFGLQSIVWGEVEGSQATDTLNPTDNSEFLFVDYEDMRIGQGTFLVTFYTNSLTLESFVTPQPLFNKNPPKDSIYSPTNSSFEIISVENTNSEFGLRTKFKLGMSEMALMTASLIPNQPSYQRVNYQLQEVAKPFLLYGINFNFPTGQTLFKADIGYKTDQGVNDLNFKLLYKDRLGSALVIESTINQHFLTASIIHSRIIDWNETLAEKEETGYSSLSWSKTYLNEDLTLNMGMMGGIFNSDLLTNGFADYQWNDRLKFTMGFFVFSISDENSAFYAFREEHRIEFKVKFQI